MVARRFGRSRWGRLVSATAAALLGLATSLPVPGAAQTPPASPAPSAFLLGVQTHFSQGWPIGLLANVRDVHALALRDSLPWAAGEPQPGRYDFSGPRADALAAACAGGRDLVVTLDPRNPFYDGGLTVYTDMGRQAFAAYVSALVDRFGSCIAAIEVGNEINGARALHYPPGTDPVATYTALLRTLKGDVKPRHPGVVLLGGSTNEIGTGFLDKLFEAGLLETADAIAVHPYRGHAEGGDVELNHLTEVMRRHGKVLPIWATEFSNAYPTPEAAAPELVKMVALMGAAGVARAYWYALMEEPWFRNMGLFDERGGKPAADAFRLVEQQLLPAGRPVRVDAGDRRTFLFRFGADRWVAHIGSTLPCRRITSVR